MEKQRKNHYARASDQAMRMRKLYSQIGEPLPVDVIIDLYRHLDKALEFANESENMPRSRKAACGKPS